MIEKLKANKKAALLVLLGIALAALLLAESGGSKTETKTDGVAAVSAAKYTSLLEERLEKLISKIDGAGNVKVMLSLDSCYENVYLKGYSTKEKAAGESREVETDEEYITVKKGSNNEECLIVKVYEPSIKGVAVVAEGADSPAVKKAITETVSAVLSISSAKISVEKMSERSR